MEPVKGTLNYTVRIHRDDDDSLWADVVELPGVFASGSNPDELHEALTESIGMYLSTPNSHIQVALETATIVETVEEQRYASSSA